MRRLADEIKLSDLTEGLVDYMYSNVVAAPDGCFVWCGPVASGYAAVCFKGYRRQGHRIAWVLRHGEITDNTLVIDHLCKNRRCVRVEHLRLVTQYENLMAGDSPFAKEARQAHCHRGHELSGDNVHIEPLRGRTIRRCKECRKIRERIRYHKNPEKYKAENREWVAKNRDRYLNYMREYNKRHKRQSAIASTIPSGMSNQF